MKKNTLSPYLALAAAAILLPGLLIPVNFVSAILSGDTSHEPLVHEAVLSTEDLKDGPEVKAFDGDFRLVFPKVSSSSAALAVNMQKLNEDLSEPWNLERVSEFYQLDFDRHVDKPFSIHIAYQEDKKNGDYKQIFYYDSNSQNWVPLPTIDHLEAGWVEATSALSFARVAVFSYPGVMITGQASWYKYKGGNFAASPDFPKGSKLRVTNLANGKNVVITVNDFGPECDLFPNRAIDLDKVAFSKIAPTGSGLINVKVEPVSIPADQHGRVLGIYKSGAPVIPEVDIESGIVMRASDGKVLWEKDSLKARPIASLSKVVAAKVFLDIEGNRDRLDEKVKYSVKDAKYNYQYCKEWESAKLSLKDGEEIKVRDLLYSALVRSANDSVETLVRVSGLERNDFIKKMNDSAKEWGATSARFIEPTGLSKQNVSSAHDYAIIVRKVLGDPLLSKISSTPKYTFKTPVTKNHGGSNTNSLFRTGNYQISSSKTGYLDEAGYCLMTSVKAGKDNLITVTLGAGRRDESFVFTEELIKYGLRQSSQKLVVAGDKL